jgi:hypothetical protein
MPEGNSHKFLGSAFVQSTFVGWLKRRYFGEKPSAIKEEKMND